MIKMMNNILKNMPTQHNRELCHVKYEEHIEFILNFEPEADKPMSELRRRNKAFCLGFRYRFNIEYLNLVHWNQ